MIDPPEIPRTIKPRRDSKRHLDVIAVDDSQVIVERTGEVYSRADLPSLIVSEPASLLASPNSGYLLESLDRVFRANPRWQFRVTPIRKRVETHDRRAALRIKKTTVSFLGFTRANGHEKSHYHYPIDPDSLCNKTIAELVQGEQSTVAKVLEWAMDFRDWLEGQKLTLRPTGGGIAAQLLKDKRFYPADRRRVPKNTNEKARPALPGNHYELRADRHRIYRAAYVDQSAAHHNVAAVIDLPHADRLRARGYFHALDDKPWRQIEHVHGHGLLRVKLSTPHLPGNTFRPPYMKESGTRTAFVFTNELPLIKQLGGRIEYVSAAWTSPDIDHGIRSYAQWALRETENTDPQRKRWLKPTLLAVYGILAAKPRALEFAFRQSAHGIEKDYPVGPSMLKVSENRTGGTSQMPTANVIQRGMIEAETRARSLTLANDLTAHGCNVLAIYADGVIVEAGSPLPLLAHPWRVDTWLTGLKFLNETSFMSRQMTKLPGVPLENRKIPILRDGKFASVRAV